MTDDLPQEVCRKLIISKFEAIILLCLGMSEKMPECFTYEEVCGQVLCKFSKKENQEPITLNYNSTESARRIIRQHLSKYFCGASIIGGEGGISYAGVDVYIPMRPDSVDKLDQVLENIVTPTITWRDVALKTAGCWLR